MDLALMFLHDESDAAYFLDRKEVKTTNTSIENIPYLKSLVATPFHTFLQVLFY